mgnify:CR=1 FL=1
MPMRRRRFDTIDKIKIESNVLNAIPEKYLFDHNSTPKKLVKQFNINFNFFTIKIVYCILTFWVTFSIIKK